MAISARDAVLSRIRAALPPTKATHWHEIPRSYRRKSPATPEELIELLTHRLNDYDAQVLTCNITQLTDSIDRTLTARGLRKLLLPEGFPAEILPKSFTYIVDRGLTLLQMDECEGVITESTLAIAETGTIVLQNVPGQGRRAASLVPDYHLCIVELSKVLATVPEAIEALALTSGLPTTFISGPSATADIEMTRIKGVHGPRFLDVILVSRGWVMNDSVVAQTGDAQ